MFFETEQQQGKKKILFLCKSESNESLIKKVNATISDRAVTASLE